MFWGTILHDMNINNIITPKGIRTSYRTFKFLYLLCNKSTASNLEFWEVSLSLIFKSQNDNRIIDVIKNNGNALNKYPVNVVILLVMMTIAGKSGSKHHMQRCLLCSMEVANLHQFFYELLHVSIQHRLFHHLVLTRATRFGLLNPTPLRRDSRWTVSYSDICCERPIMKARRI